LIERLEEKVELVPLSHLLTLNQRGKQPVYSNPKSVAGSDRPQSLAQQQTNSESDFGLLYIENEEDSGSGLLVVNSKHVREGEVILTSNRSAYLPQAKNSLTIQTNDVLINGTGVGTIGRCAPYLYDSDALPDNHVTILRTNLLDPVYLSIYLNSIIGKLQVEKYFKGSSGQIELYPKDINQFLVWNAPKPVQRKIRDNVEASHKQREQSKQLLEIAKIGVEKAIETDEATATTWINQQLKILGVSLI
jgi:type I restriction enzyme M protein